VWTACSKSLDDLTTVLEIARRKLCRLAIVSRELLGSVKAFASFILYTAKTGLKIWTECVRDTSANPMVAMNGKPAGNA